MNSQLREEKAREEAKRNRVYDPDQRWKDIRDAIRLAKANMPEHLRRTRSRVHKSSNPGV
jgi:hypothetical protein